MSYNYGRFYSVDFAIELYMELIKLFKIKRPGINVQDELLLPNHPIVFSRVLAAAYSSYIARTNELILDLDETSSREEIERIVDEVMTESRILEKIKPKQPLTNNELKQQIKNALAHAEYTIGHEEEGPVYLEISSPKIEGKINIADLSHLVQAYTHIYTLLTPQKITYEVNEFFNFDINNKHLLKKAISSITRGTYDFPNALPSEVTAFGFETENASPLTKEEQEFIYSYIMYIGLQNWASLEPDDRMRLFVHVAKPQLEKHLSPFVTGSDIASTIDYLLHHGNGHTTQEEYSMLVYKFPVMYINSIIELGFLCLNHIKEAQAKEELTDFDYHNISLQGIVYEPKSCVRIVPKEEQITKYNNQLESLRKGATRERDALQRKHQDILSLQSNQTIPPTKRKELLERKKQEIEETSQRLNQLTSRIYDYEDKLEFCEDYVETNDFFKHLRNSISHGFYSVNYTKALKEKDLGKTIFHFEDWDISKEDRTKRQKVFSCDITADRLMRIFEELKNRLLVSANTIDQQQDKRIILRDNYHAASPEKLNEYCKKLRDRGATVIKPS